MKLTKEQQEILDGKQGEAIAKVIDKIDEEPEGSEFYDRCRVNGGTSKYYTWPGDEIMAEWGRLDPVIKEIVEMG